jgi:hypothetical protein
VTPTHKIAKQNRTYTGKSIPDLPSFAILQLLEECASLVTDTSDQPTEAGTITRQSTDNTTPMPRSPSSVSTLSSHDETFENHSGSNTITKSSQTIQNAENFANWRLQCIHWAFAVVRSFDIDTETVAVAFNLLDRYIIHELGVSGAPAITREDFQLFAMTALYISVKTFIPYPRKLGVDAMVAMSRDFYAREDFVTTEQDMLGALGWRINTPTVYSFSSQFLALMALETDQKKMVERICANLSERIVADPFFVPLQASLVGLACLSYALQATEGQGCEATRQFLPRIALSVGDISSESTFTTIFERLDTLPDV